MAIIKVNNNQFKSKDLHIEAKDLMSSQLILREISINNGEKNNGLKRVTYTVVDPESYNLLKIKVEGTDKPIISQADLDASLLPVYVEIPLNQVVVTPYKMEFGTISISISSPSIKLANLGGK